MPGGVRRSKEPSGAQKRKAQKARERELKTYAGSMLRFISKSDVGQGSSKDAVPQSLIHEPGSSEATMHSAEEQGVQMEEFEAEEQGLEMEMEEAVAEEIADSDLSHDSISEMGDVMEMESQMFSDISAWEIPVPRDLRVEIIKRDPASFQNKDGPFSVVERPGAKTKGEVRQLTKEWFYQTLPDGERILRSWMAYSLVSNKLYCFCCRLFAISPTATPSKFVTGFEKWWKLNPRIHDHERSEAHLHCLENWKTLAAGLRLHRTIDEETITTIEAEKRKWRDVLHRLLDIVLLLARQNLAFRGHKEDEASLNRGNFLEMVELMSKYDPVLKEHLMRVRQSTSKLKASSVSYDLSPRIQNEFISALANHVKEVLVTEIKSAKYYGIMFDTTPDISHTDQMSEVIRYVKISNRKVEVKEVFLGFIPLKGKKAADLSDDIVKNLEYIGLDIMMCRAQGYDNAATMAGTHGGVQAILKKKNQKAIFNGCVDHMLNLCGQHSFAKNASCVTFFGTLDRMYSFFAASTHRWDVLIEHTQVSAKRLSTTRWSAHYAAVKAVKEKFDEFVEAIETLCGPQENMDTRGAAQGLLPPVCDFTFLCYLYFWSNVLQEVNPAQQYLQTKGLSLDKVVTKLEALLLFLHEQRSHLVEQAIEQALSKAVEYGIAVERRARLKKRMPGERAADVALTLQEENKRAMLECIDHFHCELLRRLAAIKEVAAMFEVVQVESLISATEEELRVSIPKLTSFYDEIPESDLMTEIPRLRRHLRAAKTDLEKAKQDWGTLDVLRFIVEWDFIESLPTLALSLRLFLTICVSVASCEKSFSKMKLIKNYLRSNMGQARLSDFAILSIESELAKEIDFDAVINNFAALKARRGNF